MEEIEIQGLAKSEAEGVLQILSNIEGVSTRAETRKQYGILGLELLEFVYVSISAGLIGNGAHSACSKIVDAIKSSAKDKEALSRSITIVVCGDAIEKGKNDKEIVEGILAALREGKE